MTRAAISARISDDRTGAGLGVQRQEQDCRALAEARGWTVVAVHVDNDLSAYSGKRRPGYEALLAQIEAGEIDVVIAWHTDRLHRSLVELERYISLCEPRSVSTVTVRAGELDFATPSGRMVARMLGSAARYESEHKSDRQRRKALEQAQAGRPGGGLRAFGYEQDRMTVRPDEAATVVECAGRVLAGESLRGIALDLNARKVGTVTGVLWSPTVLRAMLGRSRYAGLREHQGITYPGTWPALLPVDTHLALRGLFADPRRDNGGRARTRLLTGLIHCGDCTQPMTSHYGGRQRPETSRQSYTCKTCRLYGSAHSCDETVIDEMLRRLADPRLAERLSDDPVTAAFDEQTVQAGRLRLAQIGRDFGADPTIPAETLRGAITEVNHRMAAASARMAARARARNVQLPEMTVTRQVWDLLPLTTQRGLVQAVMPDLALARPVSARRSFDCGRVLFERPAVSHVGVSTA